MTGRLPACSDGSEQSVADAQVFAGDRRNLVEPASKYFVPSEKHLRAAWRSIAVAAQEPFAAPICGGCSDAWMAGDELWQSIEEFSPTIWSCVV